MVGSQIPFGFKPTHAELDITDSDSVARAFDTYTPSAVVHAAALVDMAKAEQDAALAERINVAGAAIVAEAAARAGVPMLYLSTCVVFDGEKESPYVESDTPRPMSVYGDTKYRGELAVLERLPQTVVVRTGWLFGGFERDTKFIRTFYRQLMSGRPVRAASDRFGSPTYVPDLVHEMLRLFTTGERGVVHVVNEGVASYYEVACEIQQQLGTSTLVEPVPFDSFGPAPAPRGRMEGLASERITLRPYTHALHEYVTALNTHPSN